MNFLYPNFLWAIGFLSIPIIVHIFNFRKQKIVYFPNIKFLKEVKEESTRLRKLKHLLILFTRLGFLLFLIFAFAQPYIQNSLNQKKGGNNLVSVYIDNSFSMESLSDEGKLLDKAKESARSIVSAFGNNDRFQILTNEFEGKQQQKLTKEDALTSIDKVKIGKYSRTLNEIYSRTNDFKNTHKTEELSKSSAFIISDFQKSFINSTKQLNDTNTSYSFVNLNPNNVANLYIDTCYFDDPYRKVNDAEHLKIKICNRSDENVENKTLRLLLNGQQKGLANFSLSAGECKEVEISYTVNVSGVFSGELQLDDYPIVYDDKFYFSYTIPDKIRVLEIYQTSANKYLSKIFGTNIQFEFNSSGVGALNYAGIAQNNLIIVNQLNNFTNGLKQELIKALNNGTSLVILPNMESDFLKTNELLQEINAGKFLAKDTSNILLDRPDFETRFFAGVFDKINKDEKLNLPKIYTHLKYESSQSQQNQVVLSVQNKDALMNEVSLKKGKVYVFSAPFEEQHLGLVSHALIVPVCYKMAQNSIVTSSLYSTLGKESKIALVDKTISTEGAVLNDAKGSSMVPEIINEEGINYVATCNTDFNAGNYELVNDKIINQALAFNYNRTESNLNFYKEDDLKKWVEESGSTNVQVISDFSSKASISSITNPIKAYWKWCIIICLVFLFAEVLITRYYK